MAEDDSQVHSIIEHKDEIDRLIHARYHDLAQRFGLSLEQFHLLIELDDLMLDVQDQNSAPMVGNLAARMNNSQNTVSEKISRLEKKELVRRVPDAFDRRITRVVLSEAGRNLCRQFRIEAHNRFLYTSISQMEPQAVRSLSAGLAGLLEIMKKSSRGENEA